ncbi:ArsR/SmtB family transcription factor [Arthrobacter liuii]|uniref:Transcriptional regulator n=1 Tax=Arthrobacter liuii TaxID=1476996 RepID=A0ABQ2AWS1_9MICC|nr:metalloregulator ArsR/SmtB family transcription factor [Arthrobacter liuii]GGH97143.1 transcriptional regulator [Arthrobacter liuii]
METNTSSVLSALADPNRRNMLERLAQGPASAGELARGLPVTRPAASQHLRVLRDAALVTSRRDGTKQIYTLAPEGAQMLREYAEMLWRSALAGFKDAADPGPRDQRLPAAEEGGQVVSMKKMKQTPERKES